jgi:16S rRNA (uracil1498-N3)-methyltransferase
LSVDGFERKQERWNKILVEAAKQSERAKWPSLEFVGDVDQAVKKLKDLDMVYLTDIIGNKISSLNPTPSTLGLIVGPEGGFTQKEIGDFKSLANVQAISLGPILLRAETAALAAVAIIENLIN